MYLSGESESAKTFWQFLFFYTSFDKTFSCTQLFDCFIFVADPFFPSPLIETNFGAII